MYKAIAIGVIWIGVGISSLRKGNDTAGVALFATISTLIVALVHF